MDQSEFDALTKEEAFRKSVADRFSELRDLIEQQGQSMNHRLTAQDVAIAANTESTKKAEESTQTAVTILNAINGGATVLMWLGKVGKWLGYVLTPLAIIWAMRHGKMPGD